LVVVVVAAGLADLVAEVLVAAGPAEAGSDGERGMRWSLKNRSMNS